MPRISIITVVLNSAQTLSHCIESVKDQSLSSEHIIIDGASSDGFWGIIDKYKSCLSLFISEPDKGIYDAMNKGIALATGDIIGILNADDFYPYAGVLEKVARTFADERIASCYGDLNYVDTYTASRITRRWRAGHFDARSFYWGWMPPHPTFFVRRKIYENYGTFNLMLGSAADYELMLRLLIRHCITTTYIPEVLVHMRAGGISNISLSNRIRANRLDRKAWKVNNLKPYPWTLWLKPLRKVGQYFVRF